MQGVAANCCSAGWLWEQSAGRWGQLWPVPGNGMGRVSKKLLCRAGQGSAGNCAVKRRSALRPTTLQLGGGWCAWQPLTTGNQGPGDTRTCSTWSGLSLQVFGPQHCTALVLELPRVLEGITEAHIFHGQRRHLDRIPPRTVHPTDAASAARRRGGRGAARLRVGRRRRSRRLR